MPSSVLPTDVSTLTPIKMKPDSTSNTEEDHHSVVKHQVEDEGKQQGETNLIAVAEPDLHERGAVTAVTSSSSLRQKVKAILLLIMPANQRSTKLQQTSDSCGEECCQRPHS